MIVKRYAVYILYSEAFDKYYIGQTGNIEKRLFQHNHSTTSTFTSRYRPWVLKQTLTFNTRATAMQVEKYLKAKRKAFWQRVISDYELQSYIYDRFGK